MACFIVPAAVGITTTCFRKRFPKQLHIDWLNIMTLGATVSLMVDHFFTGEISPYFPFLTAMRSPAETAVMLNEMATVGISMAIALMLAWAGMVLLYEKAILPGKAAAKTGATA